MGKASYAMKDGIMYLNKSKFEEQFPVLTSCQDNHS